MIWSMGRKNQRPELFDLLNGKLKTDKKRVFFPISNWTDVWSYRARTN
jgi:sulfate adenylyltransferase subunit 2